MRASLLLATLSAVSASAPLGSCNPSDVLLLSTGALCGSTGTTTRGLSLKASGPAGPYIVSVESSTVGTAWATLDAALAADGRVASFLPPSSFLVAVAPSEVPEAAASTLARLTGVAGVRWVREFAPTLRSDLLDARVFAPRDGATWLESLATGAAVRAIEVALAPPARGSTQDGVSVAAMSRMASSVTALCPSCGVFPIAGGSSIYISALTTCSANCALDAPASCGCLISSALVEALAADPAVTWVGERAATWNFNAAARGVTQTADPFNWWGAVSEVGPCGDGTPAACGLAASVPASLLPQMYPQAGADAPPPASPVRALRAALGACDATCGSTACGAGYSTCSGGYAAGSTPLQTAGVTGAGQVVNVGDSGLDFGSPSFLDEETVTPSQAVPIVTSDTHRKVSAYYSFIDGVDYVAGHGTHVSGTVLGDPTGFANASDVGALMPVRGMAPSARVLLMDLGCNTPGGCTPPAGIAVNGCGATCAASNNAIYAPADWNQLFGPPFDAGARISTHSWGGSAAQPTYGAQAAGIDRAAATRPDLLIIFAAGNTGSRGAGSVAPQGVAKNILTVGAMRDGLDGHLSKVMGRAASDGGDALPGQFKRGDARSCATVQTVATNVGMLTEGCPATLDAAACYGLSADWLTYQKGGYSTTDAYQANVDLAFCCGCTAQLIADGWAAQAAQALPPRVRKEHWRPSPEVARAAVAALATDPFAQAAAGPGGVPTGLAGVAGVPFAALPAEPYVSRPSSQLGQDPILADFLYSFENTYNGRTRTDFSSMGLTSDGRMKPDISAPGQNTVSSRSRGAAGLPYGTFRCPANEYSVSNVVSPSAPSARTGTGSTLFDVALSTSEAIVLLNVTLPLVAAASGSLTLYLPSSTDSGPGGGPFTAPVVPAPGGGFEATWSLGGGYQLGAGWTGAIRIAAPAGFALTVITPAPGTTPPAHAACFGTVGVNVEVNLTLARGYGSAWTHDMSGTSMATPTIAGLAALVRQYFTDGFYPAGVATPAAGFEPSASLLKAALINSASPIADHDVWSFFVPTGAAEPTTTVIRSESGFGIANLGRGLPVGDAVGTGSFSQTMLLPGRAAGAAAGPDPTIDDGAESTFCFDIVAPADTPTPHNASAPSTPLLATVAWTDPAAAPAAALALVNDLDLSLTPPAGTAPAAVLLGNNDWDAATQSRDTINNVEKISLPTPPPTLIGDNRVADPYIVTVRGAVVPSGPQAFALVVTGPGLTAVACA